MHNERGNEAYEIYMIDFLRKRSCWGGMDSQNSGSAFNSNLGGVHFEVGEGGLKLPLGLKLVRIMLETWNLAGKYTHICSFRKYTFQYQRPLYFADVSIFFFFLQKMVFFGRNSTFTQSDSVRVVLETF